MAEGSATPDPVELTRQHYEAADRRDFDALMSVYGPDPVWDTSSMGLGIYEGPAAIRGFFEDWIGRYEEWQIEVDEILHLGSGVVFVVVRQNARPAGSTGYVQWRYAAVYVWAGGTLMRITNYTDIDEARAAAERLAESRG
jgi:ketosteroid isomerase-like protein